MREQDSDYRDLNNDYREVIKLLLARMDSHPEEFVGFSKRWQSLVHSYREHFTPAEMQAYNTKLSDLHMTAFHKEVLDRLINGTDLKAAGMAALQGAGGGVGTAYPASAYGLLQTQDAARLLAEKKGAARAFNSVLSGLLKGGS